MRIAGILSIAWLCASGAEFDHAPLEGIVKKYVNTRGEVDYAGLKADRAGLDAYVERIAGASPDSQTELFPSREHELAYWLNAYNALVLRAVVNAYPVASVRNLGGLLGYGVFLRKENTLGGVKMSLRSLENDVIRKRYKEPRIHFAIVCASISCPFLDREVFTGATLNAHLDRVTRAFLAQRRNLTVDSAKGEITLSALFDWYKEDYGDLLTFVRKYATPADRKAIEAVARPKIRHYDYDWSINDLGSRAKAKSPLERELAR